MMTKPNSSDMPRGHGELVLVVDDNEELQDLSVQSLESLGYRAIAVSDVDAARGILAGSERVDVVLSDIILPGDTDGPAFVRQAKVLYPALRVIFMSAYPAAAIY